MAFVLRKKTTRIKKNIFLYFSGGTGSPPPGGSVQASRIRRTADETKLGKTVKRCNCRKNVRGRGGGCRGGRGQVWVELCRVGGAMCGRSSAKLALFVELSLLCRRHECVCFRLWANRSAGFCRLHSVFMKRVDSGVCLFSAWNKLTTCFEIFASQFNIL